MNLSGCSALYMLQHICNQLLYNSAAMQLGQMCLPVAVLWLSMDSAACWLATVPLKLPDVLLLGQLLTAAVPLVPELADESLVPLAGRFMVRDLPYSYDFFIENVLDPTHVDFAHHGVAGEMSG